MLHLQPHQALTTTHFLPSSLHTHVAVRRLFFSIEMWGHWGVIYLDDITFYDLLATCGAATFEIIGQPPSVQEENTQSHRANLVKVLSYPL